VPLSATWRGLYVGQVEARGGAHPEGLRYRPPTTAQYPDDEGYWAIYWHLADMRELTPEERIPIADMTGWRAKRPYGHPFEPEGPILIKPVIAHLPAGMESEARPNGRGSGIAHGPRCWRTIAT
jgi:hypothetical protein